MVYPYSIIDAMRDGIIKSPNYVYCASDTTNAPEKLTETALTIGKEIGDDPIRSTIFKSRVLEAGKIDEINMSEIIKEYCDKYTSTNYMKFIVFFSSIDKMDNKMNDVSDWFSKAYPDHEINILKISSKNSEECKNVSKRLENLKRKKNRIDLIASIDMLNMGYHVNNISGILMYRGTSSNIIYVQQFGRALSSGSSKTPLVFDVVDNIHRKAVFDIRPSYCKRKNNKYLTDYELDENNNLVVYDPDNDVYIHTNYYMDGDNIIDENGDLTDFEYDEETGKIYEIGDPRKESKNPSMITEECLNVVSDIATEREKMAKLEGELLSFKCHWVLETHFRAWCLNNHIIYPISNSDLKKFYGKEKKDFYDWFLNLLKRKKIDYPFYDIEKLLYIGTEDYNTPLAVCAAMKNISVTKVLDILGIA
jgi:superfamily II DNA or RNA helicase